MLRHLLEEVSLNKEIDTLREFLSKETPFTLAPQFANLPTLDKEACLITTTGSTGVPKGVILGREAIKRSVALSASVTKSGRQKSWLLSLPLKHISGLGIFFRTYFDGSTLLLPESLKNESIFAAIRAKEPTHLSLSPYQLYLLLNDSQYKPVIEVLKSAEVVLLGGAPSSPTILRKAHELQLPIFIAYGMTETIGHIVLGSIKERVIREDGALGKPMPEVEITVNDYGSLVINSPTLFLGYQAYDGEITSREKIFCSTDLGEVSDDGYVFFLGRNDSIINSGGVKIIPARIIAAALKIGGVSDAVVIKKSDPSFGEIPVLWCESKEGISVDVIKKLLRESLPRYEVPQIIFVIKAFPRFENGKVKLSEFTA